MSFDISIERIIADYNSKSKINNIAHIGACLGEEISFYRTLDPKLIYWFEPNQNLLERLTQNVTTTDFTSSVFPYAVSSKNGKAIFNIIENSSKNNPGCSSLNNLKIHSQLYPDIKLTGTSVIETINLDDFLSTNSLQNEFDLVSLDTQGHDFEILSSSERIFTAKVIVIETASVELYEGQKTTEEIDAFLLTKGYKKEYYHAFHEVWGDSLYIKQ